MASLISKTGALVALTCFFLGSPQWAAADECDPSDPLHMNDALCGPGLFSGEKGGWGYSGELGKPRFGGDEAQDSQSPTSERAQQQAMEQQSEALRRQSDLIDRKLKQLEEQQRQAEMIDQKLEQLETQQRELEELKQEVRDSLNQKAQ